MHTTNYIGTFITVSPDTVAESGTVPSKVGSIAQLQHALLSASPYTMTSDDLLFEVYAQRKDISEEEREDARAAFFAKPQACLRASPLVKQFGWGLHHDAEGRVALVGVETDQYRDMIERADVKTVPGIRSKRA